VVSARNTILPDGKLRASADRISHLHCQITIGFSISSLCSVLVSRKFGPRLTRGRESVEIVSTVTQVQDVTSQ
jgi:hypothetical protein